jgi:hypothetical protein
MTPARRDARKLDHKTLEAIRIRAVEQVQAGESPERAGPYFLLRLETMTQEPIENHVIFLGAAASYTSGYPIGQELRLRMCSRSHLDKELRKIFPPPNAPPTLYAETRGFTACTGLFDKFKDSIELFRDGGFATVDEFSKLASERYPDHVQNMKRLMRPGLDLHNPEHKFESSDYYRGSTPSLLQRIGMYGGYKKEIRFTKSRSEKDGIVNFQGLDKGYEPGMTVRYSFKEFIEREMN